MTSCVVVTDSPADDLSVERAVLHGVQVDKVNGPDEIEKALPQASAILCMHTAIDAAIIAQAPDCKVIVRYGTGLDNIDLASAKAVGIPVIGVHDYCTEEVANHTLALLLSWNRKILEYNHSVIEGIWNRQHRTTGNWTCGPVTRLSQQTLGLIGFGHIARAVAQRAVAIGLRVIATSRQPDAEVASLLKVELVSTDELLEQSDYVSLHLPLSTQTRSFMDETRLAQMKPGAVLINTARGALVDEAALGSALFSGHLGGALLDVFEQAPLPLGHVLRTVPNVIFTPHVAFYSEESLLDLRRLAAEAVLRHLN